MKEKKYFIKLLKIHFDCQHNTLKTVYSCAITFRWDGRLGTRKEVHTDQDENASLSFSRLSGMRNAFLSLDCEGGRCENASLSLESRCRRCDLTFCCVCDLSFPLSQLSSSPTLELEECVVAIDQHRHESKERGCSKTRTKRSLCRGSSCCSEVEECPESAESELDHEPGDDVELLDDVEEVHEEEGGGDPEPSHADEREPLTRGGLSVVGGG